MIEIEDAIDSAKQFLIRINKNEIKNLKVEEVDFADDYSIIITLGWDEERSLTPIESRTKSLLDFIPTKRVYKLFYVDCNNGKVEKMKIRNVNNE